MLNVWSMQCYVEIAIKIGLMKEWTNTKTHDGSLE